MRCKQLLIFLIIIVLINTVSAAPITQTKTIENFAWEQDSNLNNALKLRDYFSPTSELRFSYEVISPTTDISPLQVDISSDNVGDVNFRSPESSFIGEKYITFTAYEPTNQSNNLTSNTVMLNVTKKTSSSVSNEGTNFSITSASPSSETLSIYTGDIQMFGITVSTAENTTITWYVDTEIKKQGSENTFSFTPAAVGTFTVKASVKSGTKSIERRWTVTVQEKTTTPPVTQQIPPVQQTQNPVCGNNIKDSGENCENCPSDVVCASNAECTNGICIPKESGSSFLLTFLMILLPLLILAGAGFFAYKKGLLNKFIKQEKTSSQPILSKKLDISVLKSYFDENLAKGFKIEDLKKAAMGRGWSIEDIEKLYPKSDIEPLKIYLKENLKKGYDRQELEKISLQTGWTKEQIAQAFAEIENDNTKGNPSTDTKFI